MSREGLGLLRSPRSVKFEDGQDGPGWLLGYVHEAPAVDPIGSAGAVPVAGEGEGEGEVSGRGKDGRSEDWCWLGAGSGGSG